IIEDNQVFRSLGMQIFRGQNKFAVSTAKEGLEKFKSILPDITLLDIDLPDRNGLELLPELLSINPQAYIVMLTSSRVARDVTIAKECGASAYIVKPFTQKQMDGVLTAYLKYQAKID